MGAGLPSRAVVPITAHACDASCAATNRELPSHFNRWVDHTRMGVELSQTPPPVIMAGQSAVEVLRRFYKPVKRRPSANARARDITEVGSQRDGGVLLDCRPIARELEWLFTSHPGEFKKLCHCLDAILADPKAYLHISEEYGIQHAHHGDDVILFHENYMGHIEVAYLGAVDSLDSLPYPGAVVPCERARFAPTIYNWNWRQYDPMLRGL
eukprot:NODE_1020_length_1755_cov_75.459555_g404_i1.p1 GENE.NODE_1020_length_1755_cov_75.459555_g404_i1~~NODE_1020_length_1755_cov_75.459555_g404_i1.p1  ORF type:complete len:211 (-),score=33.26 NODE_1020_length_1755_cov_75.459555_g404_i1:1002-1634(-)